MKTTIERRTTIHKSGRVLQIAGIFDLPPAAECTVRWNVDLPIEGRDWSVGLVVGASGSGKSTIVRELFGPAVVEGFDWPADRSILDAFPAEMGIKEISGLLSSVGLSSPPAWLRPFRALSTGEQFRVFCARALAERRELAVIDEFTSVVDRTVARIGSAAIAKAVRRSGRRLVAVTCHYDVLDWLQPDWVYEPSGNRFQWRSLQGRPAIRLEIMRVRGREVWPLFAPHHYLSGGLSRWARCFLGTIEGRPAAFGAVLSFPHPTAPGWREHRFVVLPDFQGVGVGNRLSEYLAGIFAATGKPYRGLTSHPAFIQHRLRSPLWECYRRPQFSRRQGTQGKAGMSASQATARWIAGFQFIGPANQTDARAFGVYP
jgi:ABC-type thiamine transport system ATPase subunit/GNAT superfamily N-acetyltransferase